MYILSKELEICLNQTPFQNLQHCALLQCAKRILTDWLLLLLYWLASLLELFSALRSKGSHCKPLFCYAPPVDSVSALALLLRCRSAVSVRTYIAAVSSSVVQDRISIDILSSALKIGKVLAKQDYWRRSQARARRRHSFLVQSKASRARRGCVFPYFMLRLLYIGLGETYLHIP